MPQTGSQDWSHPPNSLSELACISSRTFCIASFEDTSTQSCCRGPAAGSWILPSNFKSCAYLQRRGIAATFRPASAQDLADGLTQDARSGEKDFRMAANVTKQVSCDDATNTLVTLAPASLPSVSKSSRRPAWLQHAPGTVLPHATATLTGFGRQCCTLLSP